MLALKEQLADDTAIPARRQVYAFSLAIKILPTCAFYMGLPSS